MAKTIEYYLGLPYTIELQRDAEEGWFVRVKELPGCTSQGDTAEEAVAMIQDAMAGWLEVAMEDSAPIPEPRSDEEYSGKFVVRLPRSLHRGLVETADREGVSLNQYINVALAHATGQSPSAAARSVTAQDPGWPGLKASVRQVLLAAGCREDAQELDERLFAAWADQIIAQVTAAAEGGYVRDALAYLQTLESALQTGAKSSPALASLARLTTLLAQQFETTHEIQQGVLSQFGLNHRIKGVAHVTNQELAMAFVQEERAAYSASSTAATTPKGLTRPHLRLIKTGTGW